MCSTPSKDGPKVYKFKFVAIDGHAVASTQVKFMHFGGTRPPLGRRKLVADDEDAKRNRKQVRIDDALSREIRDVFG